MRRLVLLTTVWTVSGFVGAIAVGAELSAGAARVDLTPPMEMKAALGGYGARMSRPAEGVHDRVFAKALVISDGQRRFALLTADILGFPPAFKPALVKQLGAGSWTADQIMLLPSHSHTSIEMNAINPANRFGIKQVGVYDKRLFDWVLQRCRSVIHEAGNKLVPVRVGTVARELEGWNRNRRHGDGPTDKWLTVTRLDSTDGKPLAVLANFTAHPTFMGAEHMLFSGGWPGQFQRALEATIGDDVTVLYYNGAEGDQSPVERPGPAADRWDVARQYGHALAREAHRIWTTVKTNRNVEFDYHLQPIELPETRWHPDFLKTGGTEYGLTEQLLAKVLPLMFPSKTVSGSLRLGDLVMVGIPGEMSAELGLNLKRETREITGVGHVTIGGLANEWISYILSAEEYRRGGYESSVSFYGDGLGQCISAGALAGVRALKE